MHFGTHIHRTHNARIPTSTNALFTCLVPALVHIQFSIHLNHLLPSIAVRVGNKQVPLQVLGQENLLNSMHNISSQVSAHTQPAQMLQTVGTAVKVFVPTNQLRCFVNLHIGHALDSSWTHSESREHQVLENIIVEISGKVLDDVEYSWGSLAVGSLDGHFGDLVAAAGVDGEQTAIGEVNVEEVVSHVVLGVGVLLAVDRPQVIEGHPSGQQLPVHLRLLVENQVQRDVSAQLRRQLQGHLAEEHQQVFGWGPEDLEGSLQNHHVGYVLLFLAGHQAAEKLQEVGVARAGETVEGRDAGGQHLLLTQGWPQGLQEEIHHFIVGHACGQRQGGVARIIQRDGQVLPVLVCLLQGGQVSTLHHLP